MSPPRRRRGYGWAGAAVGAAALAGVAGVERSATAAAARECALTHPGAPPAAAAACASCHAAWGAGNHPVGVDYAAAAARSPDSLRGLDEVVRRGIFLPAGKVTCLTCHDARSPWKDHVALPPGAEARPAVDPADPRTYEEASRAAARPGSPVATRPLCVACHRFD